MRGGVRVVFWDFDGTLAFRDGLWSSALASALISVAPGLSPTAENFRVSLTDGFPWHEPETVRAVESASEWWDALQPLFRSAYANAGVHPGTADEAIAQIPGEFYRPSAWTLAGDAVTALRSTEQAGYRNVILSNHAPELPVLVTALGLGPMVDTTVTSALVGAEKPNPRIFRHALQLTGAGEDVWMVGDNPVADIDGARAVGIRAIYVGDGRTLTDSAAEIIAAGRDSHPQAPASEPSQ
ncbi:haloacid dehalogenase [Curtobacterium sp. MCSS17_008]|uniref:HAD family hydrolase n=1 Tax=Curtobacterium sp. MCSS17_008 TaxID=2175647 RepID=UPI000DA76DC4|nr:HAD-IA family hydrolase [Curtobacterium sp. MCSS17_008]PZF55274.1 haloacid dehalogenase [Curtobacterium sp. MCSS17_008]